MKVLAELTIPLPEVSGLADGPWTDGTRHLFAIGDRGDGVAHCPINGDGTLGDWEVVAAGSIADWDLTQLEAIAVAGAGRVIVVSEEPAILAEVDLGARQVLRRQHLEVPRDHPLHAAWLKDANSRVEGMVPLLGGGMLAAKEKRPAALVIFGAVGGLHPSDQPFAMAGDLAAGVHWQVPADLGDVSDLAVTPDGRLALLSDQSRAVAVAEDLAADRPLTLRSVQKLPKQVTKAEGLAWLTPGVIAVASDTKKAKRNLVLLGWE